MKAYAQSFLFSPDPLFPNSTAEFDLSSERDEIEYVIVDAVTFKSKWTFVALEEMSAYSRLSIYFKFKTLSANGLILFNAGKDSHFVAVEMVNGHIVYSFNMGDGARRLTSRSKNLNDNKWHAVTVLRSIFNHHSLRVDDQVDNLTTTGVSTHLVLQGLLYFGGLPSQMYSELPNAVRSSNGFEGCFANIEFNHKVIDPMNTDQVVISSTLVSRGCSYASFLSPSSFAQEQRCPLDTCYRRGVCVQYATNQFACDCDQSSFTGSSCSEEGVSFRFGHTSSDVTLSVSSSQSSSPGTAGGMVTVNFPDGHQIDTKSDTLTFGIITRQESSVILRVDSGTTSDFMEMQLVSGKILMVYNLGTDDHSIADSRVGVSDNRYHVIRFTRSGPNSTLQIDHHNPVSRALSGRKQMAIFDTLSTIQIGSRPGSRDLPPPAARVPNPFQGIISGLTFNGMMILDLAAEGDERITTTGDVVLVPELPKRFNPNNMHSLMGNESRARTTARTDPAESLNRLDDEDRDDELILFHEEGSRFCWADHQCEAVVSSPDDLIASFVTDTMSSTTAVSGFIAPSNSPAVGCHGDEDDEDCSEGSGDGEDDEEERPAVLVLTPKVNPDVTQDERSTTTSSSTTSSTYASSDVFEFMTDTASSSTSATTSTTEATPTTTHRPPKTTAYIDPKDLEQSYRPRSPGSHSSSYPTYRPEINEVPKPAVKKPGFYGATRDNGKNNRPAPVSKDKVNPARKSFTSDDRTALTIGVITTTIIMIAFVAFILLFARHRMMDPSAVPSSHMTGHQMIFSQSGLGSSLQGCKTMAHFAPALPPASTMQLAPDTGSLIDSATHSQLNDQLRHHLQQQQHRLSGSLIPNPGPTSILKKKRDPSLECPCL